MGFQTPQFELKRLLEMAGDGTIQLPDFQRGYKWDEDRIRSLLVTVSLGHPLGVLMMLETGGNEVRFKPKGLEGTTFPAGTEPTYLLLDGQQRMTSFYQSLTGDGVVETEDSRGKQVTRRFYLDIKKALGHISERDDAVISLPGDGVVRSNFNRDVVLDVSTPHLERAAGLFPFRLVYDQAEAMSWLLDYPDQEAFKRFLTEVLSPMLSYTIPAIQLDKATTKGAVATVFEKVNQGGLPLNVFELLTATFAGDRDYYDEHQIDFRLKEDWDLTEAVIAQHPVLKGLQSTDFLQAVTLLATKSGPTSTSARRDDILRLQLADYLEWAPRLRDALGWVSRFLASQQIHSSSFLPYRTQVIPLAVIRVLLESQADVLGVQDRLSQWYWCGVLGELYGSTTETRIARDVDQVPSWALAALDPASTAGTPQTVTAASFVESRLLSLKSRNSAAYKGIYALLMADGCQDWLYKQAFDQVQYSQLKVDIHHIFPRQWCINNGIDPALRESIVNKTPLAAKTNRSIGAMSPARYLPKLETAAGITSDVMDELLASHEISPEALRSADFDAFFLARRQALLALVEESMGKKAQRDIQEDELIGGDEAPSAFAAESDDPEADLEDPDSDYDSDNTPEN